MPSIAPLVAAWQRRLGGKPGPFSAPAGSGESPNGRPIQVELFVGGLWTDITSYVMTRDGSYRVSISRGEPNESARTDPGRCSFQLNNRDGRFSPRNPLSPYYGQLGRNQPIRVSVPSGNDKSYRFWGEVVAWPQRWDITGTDVWVEVDAAGILRRIGQGTKGLDSTLRRRIPAANPIAYWPMEDGSSASHAFSPVTGAASMTVTGMTFAADATLPGSNPLPTFGQAASIQAPVPAATPGPWYVEFVYKLSALPASPQNMISIGLTSGVAAQAQVNISSSAVQVRILDSGGITIAYADYTDPNALAAFIGQWNRIRVYAVQSGSSVQVYAWWIPIGTSINWYAYTTYSGSLGSVSSISGNWGSDFQGMSIGHVSAFPNGDPLIYNYADIAFIGEEPSVRMARLCGEEGVYFERIGDPYGNTVTLGYQGRATLTSLLEDSAATDGGILYEPATALGIGYRTRLSMLNQSPAVSLSYTANNLAEVPTPVDDDRYTRNDITVTRPDGSSARATLATGALSTLPAPAGIGTYDDSININVPSDADLPNQAGWRLHLGTVDEARYPQISVNLAHPAFTSNPALRNQVLAVRPGDRITISSLPAQLQADDISQIVLGFSESIDHFQHRITFNCAPESPYRVLVLDDTMYGRIDGGSQLDQPVGPTDTTLAVASTDGSLWTTNPADLPLDWMVGGEQVTVTAVSGSTSPQTATVIRSVNGIVKAQAAGTTIQLYQPAVLAL